MHNALYELQHQQGTFKPLVWLAGPLLNSSEWPRYRLQYQHLGSGNQWIWLSMSTPCLPCWPFWIPLNGHIISLMWFAHCTLCGQFPTHSIYYIAFLFKVWNTLVNYTVKYNFTASIITNMTVLSTETLNVLSVLLRELWYFYWYLMYMPIACL